jgi:hypothetical protein
VAIFFIVLAGRELASQVTRRLVPVAAQA